MTSASVLLFLQTTELTTTDWRKKSAIVHMLKDLSLLVYNPSFGVGLPVQSVHFEGKRSKSLNAVEVCGWKEAELILLDFILFFFK